MADTTRVTVPVDEQVIKRLQEEADHPGLGDSAMVFGPDLRALLRAYRSLSAAPAPEGGAVKRACVVFQEAIDDFEAEVADVMAEGSERADLWDREITVNIDALKTVMSAALATRDALRVAATDLLAEVDATAARIGWADHGQRERLRRALATREEAPAEAGERDKRAWIDRWNAIEEAARDALHTMNELLEAPNLKRMQYALGERRDAMTIALNLPEAGTAWMRPTALRSQPEAREDAQPVGWLRAVDEEMVCAHLGVADAEDSFETAKKKLANLIQWNIDVATDPSVGGHPAPDALRAAVEALADLSNVGMVGRARHIASQALLDLAALQAEQKGGA